MKKKPWLLLAIPALMLGACNGDITSSSSSTNPDSSTTSSSSSEESYTEISKGISVSDTLIDIGAERALTVGYGYKLGFSFTEGDVTGAQVSLTNPSLGTLSGENGNWTLTPSAHGTTYLVIKSASGYTHFRKKVYFRNYIAQEDMMDFLVSVDHYQSWKIGGSDMKIVFFPGGTASISGKDEGTNIGTIPFSIEYEETISDEYAYRIVDWTNENGGTFNPTHLAVSFNGSMIHLYKKMLDGSIFTYNVFTLVE